MWVVWSPELVALFLMFCVRGFVVAHKNVCVRTMHTWSTGRVTDRLPDLALAGAPKVQESWSSHVVRSEATLLESNEYVK